MLDIFYLSDIGNNKKPIFSIGDKELQVFDDAFEYLHKATGVFIDPYATTYVYVSHQKLLVNYLNNSKDTATLKFILFLQQAIKENETLLFDGD